MTEGALRAVFMGSDVLSATILHALIEDGPGLSPRVSLAGVVTQPDRPAGRGRRLQAPAPKILALEHAIPVLQPERVRRSEEIDRIVELAPGVIIVASFGQLLPQRLLDVPPHGCLNLHPSLLPRYRGPAPIEGPILQGDATTGTTLMLMTAGMDEGPILAQETTPIGPLETAGELTERLADMSARLLLSRLEPWVRGEIDPVPQDNAAATYTGLIKKEDGRLDWLGTAEMLARRVRAFNPWPVAHTEWDGRRLRILRATCREGSHPPGAVAGLHGSALLVGTGQGLLAILELQLEGGKLLSADAFVRGQGAILGAQLH